MACITPENNAYCLRNVLYNTREQCLLFTKCPRFFIRKRTHLPATAVHGVKKLGSFESTWLIEVFSPHHELIPTNIGGHSKLSSTNVEQPTRNPEKKELRAGNIGSKSAEFVVGSHSIVTLIRSLAQKDSIVAYA